MYDDESDREISEFLAAQGLEQADLTYSHRLLYSEIEKRREDRIYRHGGESSHIAISYRKEIRELEEKIADDNEKLLFKQQKELDKFLGQEEEKHFDKSQEKDKEIEITEPINEKDINDNKIVKETIAEQSVDSAQSYKDLVLKLKEERERFFKEHFEEMASIARHPETPQEEVDYFMDRDKIYLQNMATAHYKQLLDHPENPYWKSSLSKLQEDVAAEKDRAEKLRIEHEEAQRKEREAEIARKKRLFDLMREQMTQTHDREIER